MELKQKVAAMAAKVQKMNVLRRFLSSKEEQSVKLSFAPKIEFSADEEKGILDFARGVIDAAVEILRNRLQV